MTDIEKVITLASKILNLKAPVEVRFVPKLRNKSWNAYHIGRFNDSNKVIRHVIKIITGYEDSKRNTRTILAHEMVHAWQTEYAPKSAVHGKVFQRKACELRDAILNETNHGIVIQDTIYCEGIDN
jgi:hypothetical protein